MGGKRCVLNYNFAYEKLIQAMFASKIDYGRLKVTELVENYFFEFPISSSFLFLHFENLFKCWPCSYSFL